MQDINPLGSMYHLKELERQAVPRLRLQRLRTQDASRMTGFGGPTIAVAGFFAFVGLASIWLV